MRKESLHNRMLSAELSGMNKVDEFRHQPRQFAVGCSAMDAAQLRGSDDDSVGPEPARDIVPVIGSFGKQPVHLKNVRHLKWGTAGNKSLPDPVLGPPGIPDLPSFLGPARVGRRRLRLPQ